MAFLKRHVFPLVVLSLILFFGYVGTPGSSHKIQNEQNARINAIEQEALDRCKDNRENRLALRTIILRGRNVGKPGSPGYAYYKAHPREAKLARKRVDQALRDLPPVNCEKSENVVKSQTSP